MASSNPGPREFLGHRNPDQLYREEIDHPSRPARRRTLLPTLIALTLVVAPVLLIWGSGLRLPLVPPNQQRMAGELNTQRKANAELREELDELRNKVELLESVIRQMPQAKRYLEGGFYETDP